MGKAEESSIRPLRHGVTNMTVDDFRESLTAAKPPAELTLALLGLRLIFKFVFDVQIKT